MAIDLFFFISSSFFVRLTAGHLSGIRVSKSRGILWGV